MTVGDVEAQLNRLALVYRSEAERRYGRPAAGWVRLDAIGFREESPITDASRQPIVQILLSNGVRDNLQNGMFELAHEAIHMLAPAQEAASVLEEGLAVAFSLEVPNYEPCMRQWARNWAERDPGVYGRSYRRLKQAMRNAPSDAIMALRSVEPQMRSFTPAMIQDGLGVDAEMARILCLPATDDETF